MIETEVVLTIKALFAMCAVAGLSIFILNRYENKKKDVKGNKKECDE